MTVLVTRMWVRRLSIPPDRSLDCINTLIGMANVATTFTALYILDKYAEWHFFQCRGNAWILLLLVSVAVWQGSLYLHNNPAFVASLFNAYQWQEHITRNYPPTHPPTHTHMHKLASWHAHFTICNTQTKNINIRVSCLHVAHTSHEPHEFNLFSGWARLNFERPW